MPVEARKITMNDTIGIFYELLDGRIAYPYLHDGRQQIVGYYFDDDNGSHTISIAEFQKWKPRRDLKDFPNARDPRLPYEFDLYWDIKYMSQLKRAFENSHDDLDSIKQTMINHAIELKTA